MSQPHTKNLEVVDEYLAELEMYQTHKLHKRYAEAKVNGIGCAKPVTSEETRSRGGIKKKKRVSFEGEREKHRHRLNTMERAMWEAKKSSAERKRESPHHPNKPRGVKLVDHTLENFRHMQEYVEPANSSSLVGVAYQEFQMP